MANDMYIITPTDGNISRSFNVSPYSTNGNISPSSSILDNSAVSVNTSLIFLGKGSDGYGERLQENFYHLMENFSSYIEPQRPIQGQLWYDNNDNTLKVFKSSILDVFDSDGSNIIIKLNGNPDSKYFQLVKDAIKLRFVSGFQFDIFESGSNDVLGSYVSSQVVDTPVSYSVPGGANIKHFLSFTLNTIDDILFPLSPSVTEIRSHIGLWVPLFDTSTVILDDALSTSPESNTYGTLDHLNLAENRIINLANPVNLLDAINLQYADNNYLSVSGGTLNSDLTITGNLTVNGTTTLNDNVNINSATLILDATSRITGSIDPVNSLDVMNLQYANNNYINEDGDSMSGPLTLSQQPGQNLIIGTKLDVHAATVGYVDSSISALLPNGDIYVISGSYDSVLDILSLQRSNGQSDIDISGMGTAINSNIISTIVPHIIIPEHNNLGDTLETVAASTPAWPNIDVAVALEYLSKSMKSSQQKNSSVVFTSDGRAGVYDLAVFSNEKYIGGYNSLQIYVNGIKQIANTRGYLNIFRTTLSPDIYPSVLTGLIDDPTVYTFNVDIDTTGNQLISVIGSNGQLYDLLKDQINNQLTGARAVIHEGGLSIISETSGSSSSVSITDIDLFSSLSGNVTIDPPVAGITYDYTEIGQYGYNNNTQMQFTTILTAGNIIEFVILTTGGTSDNLGYEL